jgi:hypothetical protein
MTKRPLNTLFSPEEWREELGREFTGEELALLGEPGGEGRFIQMRALAYPSPVIVPTIPDLPPVGSIYWEFPSSMRLPSDLLHFSMTVEGRMYLVYGNWTYGHSQFTAERGSSWPAIPDGHMASRDLSPLKLGILSVVFEQRAATIIAQRAWLAAISMVEDDAERLADLTALLDEGQGLIEVCHNPGEEGCSAILFRGIAGLPVFEVYWRLLQDEVDAYHVDRVDSPPTGPGRRPLSEPGRPRHTMDLSVPAERVIVEFCQLVMERMAPVPS